MGGLRAWRFLSVVMAVVVIAWMGAAVMPPSYVQANVDRGAVSSATRVLSATRVPYTPMVASGGEHTVGLKSDGTVVAFGRNSEGQCNVSSWTGITQVAAGWYYTVGLKSDGSVIAVGENTYGQCDVGAWTGITQVAAGWRYTVGLKSDGSLVAVGENDESQCDVSSWTGITQVAAGWRHTVGLKSDGRVVVVGRNLEGQCNVGTWTSITQVAANWGHTIGLKSDGSVVAAGDNRWGQCDVSSWTGITQVAAGYIYTVGLKSDGSVIAVGYNNYGQCNTGAWTGIVQVATAEGGSHGGPGGHTVGLKSDGSMVAVGDNDYLQCNVVSWTGITQVAAGYPGHTVGLKADGSVVAVGRNDYGQCNVGSWTGIAQVSAGFSFTVGLKIDGSVVAVGRNDYGQCNVGSWTGITQVSAGYYHTVGLKSDGSVVATGLNDPYGECNVGSWTGITQVSAGCVHTVGLKADGSVVSVGGNEWNECNVSTWTGITQVATGYIQTLGLQSDGSVVATGGGDVSSWIGITQVDGGAHTVGLKSDGSVVAVGDNSAGQCNVGTWTSITQVAADDTYTVGLKIDGRVVAVGNNDYGQCNVLDWNLGPWVSTTPTTNITATAATLNGNLSSLGTFDNVTVSFQWGTSPGIFSDNTTPQLKTGIGIFSHNLTDLTPAATYYFRAQATANGNTVYGSELSFTTDTTVTFPDANLEAAIRVAISKPTGDIYASNLTGLTSLNANTKGIINLTGLEYCTNLTTLYLHHNQISDLSPLDGLTNLTDLGLWSNQISDLAPLSGLTNLATLQLNENRISDLAPLTDLINLSFLQLTLNQISNLTPLASLTKLTALHLYENRISDLSPLTGLINLTYIGLGGNQISDLTLLASLTNLTYIGLNSNQIINLTPLAGLTNLTYLYLDDNQISDLSPLEGLTNLTYVGLNANQISNLTSLAGLTNLRQLGLFNNQIGNLTPLAGLTKLAILGLSGNQISELAPLARLTNLTNLELAGSQIYDLDLTPLIELTNLISLDLQNNRISDITPLVNNTGLATGDSVNLRGNPLSQTSVNVQIPILLTRGVAVLWDTTLLTIATNPATNITTTSATLNGTLSLGTFDNATVSFQWGVSTGTYTDNTTPQLKTATDNFTYNVTVLKPGQTYYYRAQATANGNTVYGAEVSFTTAPTPHPPYEYATYTSDLYGFSVKFPSAWAISQSTVSGVVFYAIGTGRDRLYIAVRPATNFEDASTQFVTDLLSASGAALTPSIDSENTIILDDGTTQATQIIYSALFGSVKFVVTGVIKAGYAVMVCGAIDPMNLELYKEMGETLNISLTPMPPSVTTNPATNITTNSAKLHGVLNSLGSSSSCNVTFQYGIMPNTYSGETPVSELTEPGNFEYKVIGLARGTTYYYRAKAVGDDTVYGEEKSFTTSGKPFSITTSTNSGMLTLESDGGNFTAAIAVPAGSFPNQPGGYIFIHGLCGFTISDIEPGATVTITMTFPQQLPTNIVYLKYQLARGWFQIPITSLHNKTITIQITDGGLGDSDGLVNGIIVDPGGVAVPSTPTPTPIPTPANPLIGTNAPTSHGSSVAGTAITTQPVQLPNIQIQSASLSESKVAPGTPVTVTADIANRGTVNGTMRIKLYVNGEEESSQGDLPPVTLPLFT